MIDVQDLTKTYDGVDALRGVRFRVAPGEVCGYLGPNGAGKSTTVRILTATLAPTSGRALVGGFDTQASPLEVKRRIGYVPETGSLYPMLSANEYLALVGALHEMPPDEIAERAAKMLEMFSLTTMADRRLDTLSKGQRQKVVISAALIADPDVILFDEPLSGLDANAALLVKDIVRGLAERGKTVLYCSHVLDIVERLCERVVILNKGQVVADGRTSELVGGKTRGLEAVFRDLTRSRDGADDGLAEAFVALVGGRKPAPAAGGGGKR